MSSRRRFKELGYIDTLEAFFQDVARAPIIGGRNEYLPLTRRIHRGALLLRLLGENPEHTYQKVSIALTQTISRLSNLCVELGLAGVDQGALSFEIDPFLDDPDQEIPPTLETVLEASKNCSTEVSERAEDLAWRYFYLLSLLPASQRHRFPENSFGEEIVQHLGKIAFEAEKAREELVEGTLRYPISIARLYVGRGLPYLDLVQEGNLGLFRATRSYNERRSHFQHYAGQWIRQHITRFLADFGSTIRVPVHVQEKLGIVETVWQEFERLNGRPPSETELFENLKWLSTTTDEDDNDDLDHDDETEKTTESLIYAEKTDRNKWAKARRKLNYYWIVALPAYSLDCAELDLPTVQDSDKRSARIDLSEMLVDQTDLEELIERRILREAILRIIQPVLRERELEIIQWRYGLYDGQEHTLEEVGQYYGITRERIRQIEAKAFDKIARRVNYQDLLDLREFLFTDQRPNPISIADQQRRRLLKAIVWHEERYPIEDSRVAPEEVGHIERLLKQYVARARGRKRESRGALLREVLEELGQPAHYSIIHEKAMARVPEGPRFPKGRTYATMFYSDQFRAYGNGIFGLASWKTIATSLLGEVVFQHCPMPLLPVTTHPSAFFDSVMFGRDLLARQSLTVEGFWRHMQAWSHRNGAAVQDIQDAFDAWYAVGLIERVDIMGQKDALLKPTLPADARLAEVRAHCLNMLCQRVLKMPELLLALTRVVRPTVPLIQKALFGSEGAGFDVRTRLSLLVSFGAAQEAGDEWRLTEIGRAALTANPPLELPDFGDVDMIEDDDSEVQIEWEYDDLGLLDFWEN